MAFPATAAPNACPAATFRIGKRLANLHGPRSEAHVDPATSSLAQKLPNSCRQVAPGTEIQPQLDQDWPMLVEFWPTMAEEWQISVKHGQCWPCLGHHKLARPVLVNVAQGREQYDPREHDATSSVAQQSRVACSAAPCSSGNGVVLIAPPFRLRCAPEFELVLLLRSVAVCTFPCRCAPESRDACVPSR